VVGALNPYHQLLAFCSECNGGLCFGVLLGQSASQSRSGAAKRIHGAGVIFGFLA
jgi:hypothetical protein